MNRRIMFAPRTARRTSYLNTPVALVFERRTHWPSVIMGGVVVLLAGALGGFLTAVML